MPPKPVMNSKRNSKTKKDVELCDPPKVVNTKSASGLSPEAEDRFELELCWCIQQLEASLGTGKLQEKQVQELSKQLQSLKSNTASLIRKRQIMRNTFGDYREKMAEDERKFSKTMSTVKFTSSTSADKKSIFIKKATAHMQNLNKQTDGLQSISQSAKQIVSDSNGTETPFQFNFQLKDYLQSVKYNLQQNFVLYYRMIYYYVIILCNSYLHI